MEFGVECKKSFAVRNTKCKSMPVDTRKRCILHQERHKHVNTPVMCAKLQPAFQCCCLCQLNNFIGRLLSFLLSLFLSHTLDNAPSSDQSSKANSAHCKVRKCPDFFAAKPLLEFLIKKENRE